MQDEAIRKRVREGYGAIAKSESSCCGSSKSCCSGPSLAEEVSRKIGYNDEEIEGVPEGANLGLGCGNPVALASLEEGETILDLGSGAGFDCFLAANKVGETGKVIGVDMTAEMLEKARNNARNSGYSNVEFRLGEIEHLPVADNSVDVIISNCVINLSPDKATVFNEAFRVLKPGGRLMVSDIVLEGELPDVVRESAAAYVGCISGAVLKKDYLSLIENAGFSEVEVLESEVFPIDCINSDETVIVAIDKLGLSQTEIDGLFMAVESAKIKAVKPV
ncbi:MAG: arsenite S-adenosylmethyltransferase [Candidatus Solincola sediminis]|uniref:Arsenite methyltransferase n=1 Tax=Candidatus Solincola sediminis TaxID=1797199 RepID=A0A1F2WN03_9ACTN|nr:MAG: arsenite S-adenosylmethyltransferase [Candidatus Solincola sediminis]OFW58216.1 MAG: arsenite S-adenosylmethyltransferase [Candidatus Solincola sediminis]